MSEPKLQEPHDGGFESKVETLMEVFPDPRPENLDARRLIRELCCEAGLTVWCKKNLMIIWGRASPGRRGTMEHRVDRILATKPKTERSENSGRHLFSVNGFVK